MGTTGRQGDAATSVETAAAITAYRGRIHRYLLSMARDPEVASDLTQETMLRALRAAGGLREPAALLSWLHQVATNVFLDAVRAERRRASRYRDPDRGSDTDAMDAISDPALPVDRRVEQAEMSACVRGYLNELPDTYRAAVLLHDGYGLTDQEIAQALRLPLATVKMRIHRGRARLRAKLAAGCQVETDDRGVIVCDPAPDAGRPPCGPDCTWC